MRDSVEEYKESNRFSSESANDKLIELISGARLLKRLRYL